MTYDVLLTILGGGNIILFIKFLIERHDRKMEKEEDKSREELNKTLRRLEKDVLRTQLLLLILLRPEEQTEILKIAEHYFVKLKANWYMTSIFKKWCDTQKLKPEWFDASE